jgi:hypothetical protein
MTGAAHPAMSSAFQTQKPSAALRPRRAIRLQRHAIMLVQIVPASCHTFARGFPSKVPAGEQQL